MAEPRLWNHPNRRWFLVPEGVDLPEGPFPIRSGLQRRRVDEQALAPYEITEDQAREHHGRTVNQGWTWLRDAAHKIAPAVPLPDTAEDVLGVHPGAILMDSDAAREGLGHAFGTLAEAAGKAPVLEQAAAGLEGLRTEWTDPDKPVGKAAHEIESRLAEALPHLTAGLEALTRPWARRREPREADPDPDPK